MTFQDIGNGLVTDLVTQVTQRTHDAGISPTSVLASHLEDQFLNGFICMRTAGGRALVRTVELFGNQSAVPAQDGFGTNDLRHFLKSLPAESFAELSQGNPVGVIKIQTPLKLVAKDPIFGGQILVPEQQFLIYRTGNVGEQSLPIHDREDDASAAP